MFENDCKHLRGEFCILHTIIMEEHPEVKDCQSVCRNYEPRKEANEESEE